MTASKYIKSQGLHDLQYVADKVGKHRDTINNWYHNNYALFEAVIDGLVYQDIMEDDLGKNWRKKILVDETWRR